MWPVLLLVVAAVVLPAWLAAPLLADPTARMTHWAAAEAAPAMTVPEAAEALTACPGYPGLTARPERLLWVLCLELASRQSRAVPRLAAHLEFRVSAWAGLALLPLAGALAAEAERRRHQ